MTLLLSIGFSAGTITLKLPGERRMRLRGTRVPLGSIIVDELKTLKKECPYLIAYSNTLLLLLL